MHLLPVLGALERRRRDDPLVVIGVHSAKFTAEQDAERVREAMQRYGVAHPVILDRDHRIWRSYAIRSWPTLVVIRPDGTLAAMAPGESDIEALDAFVMKALGEARRDGTLARERFQIQAPPAEPEAALAFPGKVIALRDGQLAVSDSGHHRVLVLDLEGRLLRVIGSGRAGLVDGPFEDACFFRPQGLAADGDTLIAADTGNHVIREIDLQRRRVRTIAGTGELGRGFPRAAVPARELPLRSPWDVALAGDYVLVAMAGAHQIWALDRREGTLGVLAGSGREALQDGSFPLAAFAQPSGLALAGARVYVADSETSAVRYLDLNAGEVRTLVGKGLFEFGDRDGPPADALLQHPIGIGYGAAGLLVADSYNGKIKRVDPETGHVETYFAGADGIALGEPSGLCQLADGRVVVADTNAHRLVVIAAGGAAAAELRPRDGQPDETRDAASAGAALLRRLDAASIGPGRVTLRLRFEPPSGLELSPGSRVALRLRATPPFRAPDADQGFEVQQSRRAVPVTIQSEPGPSLEGSVDIDVSAVLCSKHTNAACWPVEASWRLPLKVALADGPAAVNVPLVLPDPR
jgi:sugar lactone lactonase YvrE